LIFYRPAKIGNNWFSTRPIVILHVHQFVFSWKLCKHFFVCLFSFKRLNCFIVFFEHLFFLWLWQARRKVTRKIPERVKNFFFFPFYSAIKICFPCYFFSCTKILNFPYFFTNVFFFTCVGWGKISFRLSLIFRLLCRFYLLYIAEFENEMKIKKLFFPSSMKNAAQFFLFSGLFYFLACNSNNIKIKTEKMENLSLWNLFFSFFLWRLFSVFFLCACVSWQWNTSRGGKCITS